MKHRYANEDGDEMIGRIIPSATERDAQTFFETRAAEAAAVLRSDGALILEGVVNASRVRDANEAFMRKYACHLGGHKSDDALEVGDERVMVTIDVEPPFDQVEFFANPWILSVLREIFGGEFVLGAYGVVCSLPGAPRQHRHRDGGILFPQFGLDHLLPVTAMTVVFPLIEMNNLHGTTELWLGTHRDKNHVVAPIAPEQGEMPIVAEGSCILWDYRLIHSGTPNRSSVPRPILYLTYCRPWFLDHLNYTKQPLLSVCQEWLATLRDDHRQLLARAAAHWLPKVVERNQ